MRFKPYTIIHLDTSQEISADFLLPNRKDNRYIVVWWKHYPLGHIYVYGGSKSTPLQFRDRLFQAIRSTLVFYNKAEIPLALQEAWLTQNKAIWDHWMQSIFKSEQDCTTDDISVIICTRNRASFLKNCLQLLQQQCYKPKEIIVVDNAPTDEASKHVVASFPGIRYCVEPRPGLDFARNAGARAATGDIIAYTDDDAILHPLWTCYIKRAFSRPDIMAVTGLILAAELQQEAQMLFETYWSFNRGYIFKEYDQAYFNRHLSRGVPAWEIGAGANMAFRKEIFGLIGYFDERLDVGAAGCNGDSEYWYRILANGYTIQYTPLAIASHFHRKDLEGLKKQIFYYMRGFTTALFIQYERFGHEGNMFHLYKNIFPYYLKKLPYAIRRRFRYKYTTYPQEVAGVFSGIRFYRKNKSANH